jgi:hypothetical protein
MLRAGERLATLSSFEAGPLQGILVADTVPAGTFRAAPRGGVSLLSHCVVQ